MVPDFQSKASALVSTSRLLGRMPSVSELFSLFRTILATGASQLNSSLLTISVIAVLLPAAFHFAAGADIQDPQEGREILAVSHGVSLSMLRRPRIPRADRFA